MDPVAVPQKLQDLTEIEEMLIARACLTILCVLTANRLQRDVLNLSQDIQANNQKEQVRKRFK